MSLIAGGALLITLLSFEPLGEHIMKPPQSERPAPKSLCSKPGRLNGNDSYILGVYPKVSKQALVSFISEYLQSAEHTTPVDYKGRFDDEVIVMTRPSREDLMGLEHADLARIYHILSALSQKRFRRYIDERMSEDTRDTTAEHGGILRLKPDGRVTVRMVESNPDNPFFLRGDTLDLFYGPKDMPSPDDLLTRFHFHAQTEDEQNYAAPQPLDFPVSCPSELVLSRLSGGRINADIAVYGESNGRRFKVELDLGIY